LNHPHAASTAAAHHGNVSGSTGMRNRAEVIVSVWNASTARKTAYVGQRVRQSRRETERPIPASANHASVDA